MGVRLSEEQDDYRKRFSGMASIYEKGRPNYHPDAIKFVKENTGLDKQSVIADIGAGTGKLTEQLLELEHKSIIAVEPNIDMMNILTTKFVNRVDVLTLVDDCVMSTLEDSSVDLITVGQALHWFNTIKFAKACKRVLKPDGKLALFYNSRITDCQQALDVMKLLRVTCPKFSNYAGGLDEAMLVKDVLFSDYRILTINNPQVFDEDGWINRNLSSSYCPRKGENGYQLLIEGLHSIFVKYQQGNRIILPSNTVVFLGTVGKA